MVDLLVDVLMVWEAIQQVLLDAKAMNVKSMKNAEILKLVLVSDAEIHVQEVSIFRIFMVQVQNLPKYFITFYLKPVGLVLIAKLKNITLYVSVTVD